MIAAIVDKKQFKWLEEQLSGFIETSCLVSLLAHDAPQFLQDQIAAGDGVAAQHAALKFANQQRSRSRRELAQKFPQSFDGRFGARHPRSIRIQALRLDTAAAVKTLLSVLCGEVSRRQSRCRPDCGTQCRGRSEVGHQYRRCG